MTRVFGRGELKRAVLEVVADIGPAHGYAVLDELRQRVGGQWRPSPGAVYPALLALQDAGLIAAVADRDDRAYRATARGLDQLIDQPRVVHAVAARLASHPPDPRLGDMVDHFAAAAPHRRQRLDPAVQAAVRSVLEHASSELEALIESPPQGASRDG